MRNGWAWDPGSPSLYIYVRESHERDWLWYCTASPKEALRREGSIPVARNEARGCAATDCVAPITIASNVSLAQLDPSVLSTGVVKGGGISFETFTATP